MKAASLDLVLAARDMRAASQRALLSLHGLPLLSLTLVSPGPIKDSPGRRLLMDMAETALADDLRAASMTVRLHVRRDGTTGPEALWVVQALPEALKRLAITLEESRPWGRLLDADVIVPRALNESVPFGRHLLGCKPRSCLVCGEVAKACISLKRHPPAEATAVVAGLIGKFTGRP